MAKRTPSSRKRTTRRPAPQRPRRKTRKAVSRRAASRTRGQKARGKARKPAARPPARRPVKAKRPGKMPARPVAAKRPVAHETRPPTLQRERRRLSDAERTTGPSADSRLISEAKSGHDATVRHIREHNESGPVLTAGDVDAKWEDAYAVGDEAPGGDNPTPDQNEVDAIGRALGTEYADDEELMGGEEIEERDEHRWELDPDSKDEDE